jgi:hypothetical protein
VDSRGLTERAKGALMERERLDAQEAVTHLRRAARSSGRKLAEVAGEVAAGLPLPRRRTSRRERRRNDQGRHWYTQARRLRRRSHDPQTGPSAAAWPAGQPEDLPTLSEPRWS